MKHPTNLPLAIALLFGLGSPNAWALGLGGISVKSGLNEPLVAEIVVNEGTPDEAEGLIAKLASAQDFSRVGLDLSGVSVPLAFDVVEDGDGRTTIRVTSESPVREPFLSFLVDVTWPKGRLLREYTVLLDPPVVAPAVIGSRTVVEPVREAAPLPAPEPLPPSLSDAPAAAPVDAAAEAPAATPAEAPAADAPLPASGATADPASEPAPSEPAPSAAVVAPSGPGEYGPVAAGETLWEVASAARPGADITLNQMMLAIVRANPDAFVGGNANQLRRGAVLRIPSAADARAIAVADAAAEIAAQNEAWQASRAPTLVADGGAAAPAGRAPAPGASRDDSRLELVPPRSGNRSTGTGVDRPGTAGGTDTAQIRADLARTREQLASREQEAVELRSRVRELERIQSDQDRLVTLKDSEIATLQRQLAEAQAEVERQKAAAGAVVPPIAEPAPAEPAPAEPAPAEPAPAEPAPAEPAPAEPAPVEPAPAEPEPAPGEPVAVSPVPEPAPVQPMPIDAAAAPWWRENLALLGASGALLLGGILLLLMRGRRKPAAKLAATSAAAKVGGSVADAFEGGVFAGAVPPEVNEESDLLDRLAADPTDLELHLALLRHYHGAAEGEKFEGAANAMFAQLSDAQEPAWLEACELGRDLLPGNPLFEPAEFDTASFGSGDTQPFREDPPPSFDLGSPDLESTEPVAEPERFDFDLEVPPQPEPPVAPVAAELATPVDNAFNANDFQVTKPQIEPPRLDFDSLEGEDAVGTKLDLARAYLEMGDPDGARNMLQEVLEEGSETQKAEARRLLADIG